jgi:hypothetical protein
MAGIVLSEVRRCNVGGWSIISLILDHRTSVEGTVCPGWWVQRRLKLLAYSNLVVAPGLVVRRSLYHGVMVFREEEKPTPSIYEASEASIM